ncbi:uncharacterized protein B0495.5 [Anastrepha obliqua]|uniref:uncharacterized protein B0495.5 n=1 Tax=Anastrepha obliqua TaxID=95512 RepID=UPI0024095F29|nr:uncharacterized protein B0495.5 [Anastrepha obliqua]
MFNNILHLNWIRKVICNTIIRTPATNANKEFLTKATASAPKRSSCGIPVKRSVFGIGYDKSKDLVYKAQGIQARKMSDKASPSSSKASQQADDEKQSSTVAVAADSHKYTNRLVHEKSPYLLQHAHNPVDWYPWGDEAIERAREENKLIFLSVGYSTCHWCHVMEGESFENASVAKLMNRHFVNIKVDREERPDIDKIYMQFVLMLNGSGGWPMSVWLTPDLAPITAGTYFPPNDRWGMPSFTTVLKTIASKWELNQEELKVTGKHIITAIQKSLSEKTTMEEFAAVDVETKLQETLSVFKRRYDQNNGGFGSRPKFPEISRVNFLFHAYVVTQDADVLDMALQTLQHIGKGGIHDHVFGGFARYAVDDIWHVPHFEKMLYDQGQLMTAYAHAYKLTNDEIYLRYGDGIFRYLMKDLRHPEGAFFAGEDADSLPTADASAKVEGAFYAWTWAEVKEAVNSNAALYAELEMDVGRIFDIYAFHYDLRQTGNVEPASDPHGHLTAKNIHIVRGSIVETCDKFGITEQQLRRVLLITNEVLHKIRDQRPRPHLDTKIICSWNGLVLSGLSKMANSGAKEREKYLNAAKELYEFIHKHLYDAERKVLRRSCYGLGTDDTTLEDASAQRIDGFLDDYAFLIRGLLDYHKASLDGSALKWAKELQDIQDARFWDDTHGAYFYSEANSPNVIVRLKEDHDGAEPCGNSIAARNLILLAHYLNEKSYQQRAVKLMEFFADVRPFGYTLPAMMSALLLHDCGIDSVTVVGSDSASASNFIDMCRKYYIPGMIVQHVDPQHPEQTYSQSVQNKFKMVNDKTTVYVCHDRVCRLPITDPMQLEQTLNTMFSKNKN